ncbi:Hypothetical predicted protein [Pelobates cultripes]|uniref:Uncharacterized protein n=1 Tax=Pelobates cultripes TaxID=61616 RepID=A0AAD1SAI3_PELCU|nr:Hypothetical predicted protein [Pelobates cultripes]
MPTRWRGAKRERDRVATQRDSRSSEMLTKSFFEAAMDTMSTKLIATWQLTATQLKTEIANRTSRMTRIESDCKARTMFQNDMADHVQALEHKLNTMETRMADTEDGARKNNLRLVTKRPPGIREGPHACLCSRNTSDMLLVESTGSRNPLTSQTRRPAMSSSEELVLRSSRSKPDAHPKYPSTEKPFTINTPEEGTTLLANWGLSTRRHSGTTLSPRRSATMGTAQAPERRRAVDTT